MDREVEAVLLDMGGTLRGTRKRSREDRLLYTGEILKLLDSSEDPARFSRRLARRGTAYRQWARQTLLELNEPELWTRWMLPEWPQALVHENAARLNYLWREATGIRALFPATADIIYELFRRGYRIGLVSNTTSSTETLDVLAGAGLTGYFETIILSAVVGIRKPDPAILLKATGQMGIEPGKCAYVGDLPHRDVAAARKAGFSRVILIHHRTKRRLSTPVEPNLKPDEEIRDLRELLDIFPIRKPPEPRNYFKASASSMWATKGFSSLGDFMEAARRLGFAEIELNHQVDSTMLEGIHLSPLAFSSVHEPCPADVSAPELKKRNWLVSATDEACRFEGVKSIQRSIDLARKIRARVIVIHAGMVLPDKVLEERLRRLYDAGQYQAEEYLEIKQQMIKMRQEMASACLEAVKKSLAELLAYAAGSGICLGIENRYHFFEIPNPDELGELLNLAGPNQLGFIYDVGHAQALSRLGFYAPDEWLKRYAHRMIAVHLHDVKGLRDHLIPGQGEVDFDLLAKFLPESALRTLEFQGHFTQEQVLAGLRFLQQHGCISHLGK